MSVNRKMLGTGIVALAMCAGAQAEEITWVDNVNGGDGQTWGDPLNWEDPSGNTGYPTAADRAIIPPSSGYIEIKTGGDYIADSLELGQFSDLWIIGTGRLTLENDDLHCNGGPSPACPLRDNHVIDGTLHLKDGGTLRFVNEPIHVLGGSGEIQAIPLSAPDATIVIDSDVQLYNRLARIWGSMTISGVPFTTYPHDRDGTFINETTLESGGEIVLTPSTNLEDIEGARWIADGFCAGIYAAEMKFYRAEVLLGDFETLDTESCLRFYEDVTTFGAYIDTGCGGVWVDATNGAIFEYYFYDPSNCPNGNPGTWNGSFWYIDYDYCPDCPE